MERNNQIWRCQRCGAVNQIEFQICSSCGNMYSDANVTQNPQNTKTVHPGAEKKTKKRGGRALLIAFLALVIVAAMGTGIYYYSRVSGIKKIEQLLSNGEYEQAHVLAKGKSHLRQHEIDAVAGWAKQLAESGEFEKAVELLKDYTGEEGIDKIIAEIQLMEVEHLLDQEFYSVAQLRFFSIDKNLVDTGDASDRIYLGLAKDEIDAGNLPRSKDHLKKVNNKQLSDAYISAIDELIADNYRNAAEIAVGCEEQAYSYDNSFWKKIINKEIDIDKKGLGNYVAHHAVDKVYEGVRGLPADASSMNFDMPEELLMPDGLKFSKDDLASCVSLESKKTIIIWDIQSYPDNEHSYYLAADLMEYLPEELYPSSLEEVGNVIRLHVTAASEGWYNIGASKVHAVIEKVTVTTTRPSNLNSARFGSLYANGPEAPRSISYDLYYNKANRNFISGGMPTSAKVGELVIDAINDIINS